MELNKVIVMMRLEDGSDIKVSTKSENKPFSVENYNEILRKIECDFVSKCDDCIYFTVRRTLHNKKDNWKVKTLKELTDLLKIIFNV